MVLVSTLVAACGSVASHGPAATPPAATAAPVLSGVLDQAWHGYRAAFVQGDGRVVDPERGGVSTSEGQSYAMLRAVWSDDRSTFDSAWKWTQDNLGTPETGLFGYLWGKDGRGRYSLLSRDSAADADEDVALALVLASRRWDDTGYLAGARGVLTSIWGHDVATAGGRPYLSAGSWAPGSRAGGLVVNPSYMAPYEYRVFASVDPGHPWAQLVDTAYAVIRDCTAAPLSTGRSAGLPPNWCAISDTGQAGPAPRMPSPDLYGYDAFRTMWRVAVDVRWNGSAEGRAYLGGATPLLRDWAAQHRLATQYTHDGRALGGPTDPTVEGGDVGALLVDDPAAAQSLVETALLPTFSTAGGAHFGDPHNYYEQNWVWFGIALVSGAVQSLG
jgi:endo-1,4-beta-D-glucanase Y